MIRARASTGYLVAPAPGQRATCPYCESVMIAKCGAVLDWHWAHLGTTCQEWEIRDGRGQTHGKQSLPPAGTCYLCDRWERGCTFVEDEFVEAWKEEWTRPTPDGLARVYDDAEPCPRFRPVHRRHPYGQVPASQALFRSWQT